MAPRAAEGGGRDRQRVLRGRSRHGGRADVGDWQGDQRRGGHPGPVAESGGSGLDSQSECTFNLKSENLSQIVRFKESFNTRRTPPRRRRRRRRPPPRGPLPAPLRVLEAAEETVGTLEVESRRFAPLSTSSTWRTSRWSTNWTTSRAAARRSSRRRPAAGRLDELEFGGRRRRCATRRGERRAHARLEQLLPGGERAAEGCARGAEINC